MKFNVSLEKDQFEEQNYPSRSLKNSQRDQREPREATIPKSDRKKQGKFQNPLYKENKNIPPMKNEEQSLLNKSIRGEDLSQNQKIQNQTPQQPTYTITKNYLCQNSENSQVSQSNSQQESIEQEKETLLDANQRQSEIQQTNINILNKNESTSNESTNKQHCNSVKNIPYQMFRDGQQFLENISSNIEVDILYSETNLEKNKLINLVEQTFGSTNEGKLNKYQRYYNRIFEELSKQNYYLTKYLTSGGEGDIFLGYQLSNHENEIEEYVFKFYFDVSLNDLQEEINIMKSFEYNINIIKLQEEMKIDDHLYILVLEKCEHSLKDELMEIIHQKKEFSIEHLFQIIFDLLDGLVQLRIYQTLHLDIKPANILKTQLGNFVYTDFGCSSKIKQGSKIQSKGYTERYASLEQLNHQIDKINYPSDVYCLGKTLTQVLQVFIQANKNTNQIYFIEKIKKIIQDNMEKVDIQERQDIQVIHQSFFQLLIDDEFQASSFLVSYFKKIVKIKDLFAFDVNKDIQYFQSILLYYSNIHLTMLKLKRSLLNPSETNNIKDIPKQEIQNKNQYDTELHTAQQFLGQCYLDLGDASNAFKYAKESLETSEQLYEGNHSIISSSLAFLGNCYQNLGDDKNALLYATKSYEMLKQIFSGNHPLISSSLLYLGECYKLLKFPHKALKFARESHDMNQSLYNGIHPQVSNSLYFLGQCYFDLGDLQIALQYAKEAHEMFSQMYEGSHPQKSASLLFLGVIYRNLGDTQSALKYVKQSLEMSKQVYGGNHPLISTIMYLQSQCYYDLGELQNALKSAKESLDMNKQVHEENHPQISISLYLLAQCYIGLEDYQNGLKFAEEALEMRKQFYQGNHPSIVMSLHLVGHCYLKQGDDRNLKKYARQYYEMKQQLYEENHPTISSPIDYLAMCFEQLTGPQSILNLNDTNQTPEVEEQLTQGFYQIMSSMLGLLGRFINYDND